MVSNWIRPVCLSLVLASAVSLTACNRTDPAAEAAAEANIKAGETFLAEKAKEPGVQKLPKGLLYKVITPATDPNAPKPTVRDTVKIHYEGRLIDGTVFDSSYDRGVPAAMPLDGLVEAWKIAVPQMKTGETWELYVPAQLAYGETGAGPIPPNSVLVFKIQLIGIQP
ncbi:FKBP-type peptidyl-prolyl cis-trans isomerase [Asticcacaulis excentricus]|uniref:Peptidyl-prolyl cis-trans isomerase n=1 Tax=Asticcacaulis excentricus TaxID=78587 RepID=A0A3G9G3U4_9CAUL|nr:FKBP-type peptidyl-prolyl cis-trans isomerase [Asticcacaulis excentricus]BBF81336.1 FKBP-type peptidyl-prolyl cis-trans isomerase FklB [Asticcacaulis excentricus]